MFCSIGTGGEKETSKNMLSIKMIFKVTSTRKLFFAMLYSLQSIMSDFFIFAKKNKILFSTIRIFALLVNLQTLKSVISSHTLLHIRGYSFDCFLRILRNIRMKFTQMLVQLTTNISNWVSLLL